MTAVLMFLYDCGFEISIPASRSERQELVEILEAVADQRHERECLTCHPVASPSMFDGPGHFDSDSPLHLSLPRSDEPE